MSIPPPTAGQARIFWVSLTALAVAVLVVLGLALIWAFGWALRELSAVLMPAALALILAYILDPVVESFVRRKVPRTWAIVLVFVLGLVVAGAVLASVVPDLVRETERLINEMPKDVETLRVKADDFLEHSPLGRRLPALWRLFAAQQKNASNAPGAAVATNFPPIYIQSPETNALTTNSVSPGGEADTWKQAWQSPVGGTVLRHVGDVLSLVLKWLLAQLGKVRTWAEFVLGFILMPLFLFYFLREKEAIAERWTDYLPVRESRVKEEMVFVLKSLNDCMIVFFRGQVLVALCVGTLLAIGYLSMGLNYAVLLGLVAATLGVIPYVGAIVTLVLALSVATVQFGDWGHPLLVLGIAATVKLLEDFVISPKIIGDRSGLHPLTIIIAVLVGTTVLGGVLGALFAIPLTAVLRTLMFRYVWKERGPAPGRAQTG